MVVQNYFVKNNKINIKSTLIAQIVSNTTSLLIILLGMFYLDPSKYIEIQLTLAYLVFCGFMHFGLIDGIELRIAGDIIKKNSNGSLAILIFTLSSLPGLIYFIVFFKSLDFNMLIAFLAFPIINVNTLLIVLFRSYGYSWIAASGLILEKFIVIIYLLVTAKYAIHLINYFILFSLISLIFYLYKLNIVNIKLDFGLDLKITLLDFKRGSILMFSNILYSIMSFGSLILAAKFNSKDDISKLAISISLINVFIGISAQLSSVFFPLLASKEKLHEDINHIKYNIILEKYLPFLIFLVVIILFIFNYYFKNLFKTESILNYAFMLLPLAYFEIKNQIINITLLKLNIQLKEYLVINLISIFIGLLLLTFAYYFFQYSFLIFVLILIVSFIIRFIFLSFFCKTLSIKDFIMIFSFFTYLYLLIKC